MAEPDDATDRPSVDPWAPPGDERPPTAGQPEWGQPTPGQPQWGQPPQGPPGWAQPQWGQPVWGWAPPPDPKAQRRKRILAVSALAGVVLLLIGGLTAAGIVENRREARVQAEVDALLPALQAFVELERGLPFLEPVEVEVLDDDDFLAALYEEPDDAAQPQEGRDAEQTLVALGLLDDDVDLDEAVGDSLDAGVVGFYDPADDRLVVRGQDIDPFVELVLVHELTHAVQDQHFDLHRPEVDEADDERALAFDALVEGDASRVELAWFEAQSPARQEQIAEMFGDQLAGPAGEAVVEDLLGFPYYAGPEYVDALLGSGGQPALDAAFTDPPTTTEQVLDPTGAGQAAAVARPDVEGEVVDEGVLGVLGLALLLGTDPLEVDVELVWDGDRYATVERDGQVCTVADVATDAPSDVAALTQALHGWSSGRPGATVEPGPGGTVRLTACT